MRDKKVFVLVVLGRIGCCAHLAPPIVMLSHVTWLSVHSKPKLFSGCARSSHAHENENRFASSGCDRIVMYRLYLAF